MNSKRYENESRFCMVLALATLWACYDTAASEYLPAGNPVEKIQIKVISINRGLDIVDAGTNQEAEAAAATGNGTANNDTMQVSRDNWNTLVSLVRRQEEINQEHFQAIKAQQAADRQWMGQQFDRVVNNQRRFGGTIESAFQRQDPVRQARNRQNEIDEREVARQEERQEEEARQPRAPAAGAAGQGQQQRAPAADRGQQRAPARAGRRQQRNRDVSATAMMKGNIKTLMEMWVEWTIGYYGKAAKDFTSGERNKNSATKVMYGRRLRI
ncbi:unknown protein [Seminavis robusta]|uniref:Uncharacterized protein n=1 Tax=Seminavis robusta TaxID=568900 RepID=A0A9N8DXZ1_9STRA|nr:unknown protein [Seminavis robusta]|eukprot:Sro379_g130450.1 n/a (270) ;mRNA; r:35073-35998